MTEGRGRREEGAAFEALVADLLRGFGYRVREGPRANPGAPGHRPDMAVDVDGVGTVLIETKPRINRKNLRNAVEQLHALLYSYPTAKAGFLVTGQPAEAGWPPELVSVVDLQDRLSSLRRTTNGARDAEFARLTPGTVDITVKLPFVSVAATVQLPVVFGIRGRNGDLGGCNPRIGGALPGGDWGPRHRMAGDRFLRRRDGLCHGWSRFARALRPYVSAGLGGGGRCSRDRARPCGSYDCQRTRDCRRHAVDASSDWDMAVRQGAIAWQVRDRLTSGVPPPNFWANYPNGIDQVGRVYTAQGSEFDYVGVIWGRGLRWDPATNHWTGDPSQSHDSIVKRSGDRFTDLVKRTNRVLLTRGLGCYVYFDHPATRNANGLQTAAASTVCGETVANP